MAIEISTLANLGEFDIELGVANPRTSGVSAGEGAIGYATNGSRWVKVGAANTDWEQILISTNGEFIANFEMADATGQVLDANVIGHVGGVLVIGDGTAVGGVKVAGMKEVDATSGTAWIGGDDSGNTRGSGALDVQGSRSTTSQIASGSSSSAIGNNNSASGFSSSAIGNNNSASGSYSSAFGYQNFASGSSSSAIGNNNSASGFGSFAIGNNNSASGVHSSAIGRLTKTTIDNTIEIGYWSSSTTRGGSVRIHPNGQVAMTIEDSATAPIDGGATAGSEADGTLARGMFAIQKNGTAVTLYFNSAGTIQSLPLGTLA